MFGRTITEVLLPSLDSKLGLLTIVELSLLYLTFFKTILAALFRTISLPLLFCLQNLHFSMTISPSKIRIFPVFLAVISTDKPVNRSKLPYASM